MWVSVAVTSLWCTRKGIPIELVILQKSLNETDFREEKVVISPWSLPAPFRLCSHMRVVFVFKPPILILFITHWVSFFWVGLCRFDLCCRRHDDKNVNNFSIINNDKTTSCLLLADELCEWVDGWGREPAGDCVCTLWGYLPTTLTEKPP